MFSFLRFMKSATEERVKENHETEKSVGLLRPNHALGPFTVSKEGLPRHQVLYYLLTTRSQPKVGQGVLAGDGVVVDAAEGEKEGHEDTGSFSLRLAMLAFVLEENRDGVRRRGERKERGKVSGAWTYGPCQRYSAPGKGRGAMLTRRRVRGRCERVSKDGQARRRRQECRRTLSQSPVSARSSAGSATWYECMQDEIAGLRVCMGVSVLGLEVPCHRRRGPGSSVGPKMWCERRERW